MNRCISTIIIAMLATGPVWAAESTNHEFNVGLAARVVTSDPQRINGTRAGRLDEFPTADVFLTKDVPASADGTYTVPVTGGRAASGPAGATGVGCIGLEWAERRVLTQVWLRFAPGSPAVAADGVTVHYWSSEGRKDSWGSIGQTPWQGKWEPLPGRVEREGDRLLLRIDTQAVPEFRDDAGTLRIRWLLPTGDRPIVVRELGASTPSKWTTTTVRIETDGTAAGPVSIQAYNGQIYDTKKEGPSPAIAWDVAKPRELSVLHCVPEARKADRTLLRFTSPAGAFAVAIEDVLNTDGVYVKDYGVFISRAEGGLSLDGYRRKFTGAKTVLQRVREMPEQTFEQAMEHLWRPIQNNGPTLLSLAADNRKFIVERAGEILFKTDKEHLRVTPRFGGHLRGPDPQPKRPSAAQLSAVSRRLDGDWLPIPVNTIDESGVRYVQRTFVAPLDGADHQLAFACERPLCVTEFTIENTTDQPKPATLHIDISPVGSKTAVEFRPANARALIASGGRVHACIDHAALSPLRLTFQEGTLMVAGDLPAKAAARCALYLPGWDASPDFISDLNKIAFQGSAPAVPDAIPLVSQLRADVEAYWNRMLGGAMQVEVPEPLLMDMVRSTEVHCLMAARQEDGGKPIAPGIAPWIAADRYGPLDTEAQAVILGMDLFGHADFARRSHEFFVNSYNADGMLAKGYTLMGTGQHLWTLAEHYLLTRDDEWLRRLAPQLLRPCDWIKRQRDKTKRLEVRFESAAVLSEPGSVSPVPAIRVEAGSQRLPEYGLVPPGVLADWNRYAYYFYANAHYDAGVRAVAAALARINHPQASQLEQLASEYRDDILRAYRWNQARMPVVPLRDGSWVPATPSSLYSYGLTRDFYGGPSATGHDVEVGGNHLIPLGLVDPRSRQADWIIDYMEDRWFLIDGIFKAYPAAENKQDWFNRGGFAKLQPHYARTSDIYALRDEVKPFIRTYFNTFPVLLNRENLTYWEHMNNGGAWDKTHESGWFLQMTRTMLVMERGQELWLAPFVPCAWLKEGMHIAARNAPTHFGRVGFELVSHPIQGTIDATIDTSTVSGTDRIVLRLRHPEEKRMYGVTVDGVPHADFDPLRQTVRLKPTGRTMAVQAAFR